MSHYRWQEDKLILQIHVQPGAKRFGFVGQHGDSLKLCLNARAQDGQANAQLIDFIAEYFGVAKRTVSITRGLSSRAKVVVIDNPKKHLDNFLK